MKIFQEYILESVEIMGDSLQYIMKLMEEKEMLSRLMRFERDSVGDLTSISFDVSDVSPKRREYIFSVLQENGFKTATIEFHDWNKLWLISIERLRIQRKSSAQSLISAFYRGLTTNESKPADKPEEKKKSMLERILGKKIQSDNGK